MSYLIEHHNYRLANLGYETPGKRFLRGMKYALKLGKTYSGYARQIDFSVSILRKPA